MLPYEFSTRTCLSIRRRVLAFTLSCDHRWFQMAAFGSQLRAAYRICAMEIVEYSLCKKYISVACAEKLWNWVKSWE